MKGIKITTETMDKNNLVNLCSENSYKWFEIIHQNNEVEAKALLEEATGTMRDAMLNGNFDFGEIDNSTNEWSYTTNKPLFLAAIFGSLDVLKLFNFYGADFCQVDEEQNNVVHSLISMCFSQPRYEDRCIAVYHAIVEIMGDEDRKRLLLSENGDSLRPLELAAHYSCLKFFKSILETPGVHTSCIQQKGIQEQSWIDVTEYESFEKNNRRNRAPLVFLSLVEKRIFQDDQASKLFTSPFIKKWVKAKLLMNSPVLILWAIFRFLHFISFYIAATAGGDETARIFYINENFATKTGFNTTTMTYNVSEIHSLTHCNTYIYFSKRSNKYWLAVISVWTFGSIIVLFDIIELSVNYCRKAYKWSRTPRGRKKYFVNETFYR